jgi:hypothetical protein
MLNLIFPDGTIVTGATYQELEEALRASQWRTYKTRREFRRALRHRAAVWSGRPAKPVLYQSPKAFIYHLVNSGMCMIETAATTTTPTTHQEES